MKDHGLMLFLVAIAFLNHIAAEEISYSLKEDQRNGNYVIQFNDKTKHKKVKKLKHLDNKLRKLLGLKSQHRKLGGMASMGMGMAGGAVAGGLAAKTAKEEEFKQNIRNLRMEHRSLEMKNDVEKDNIHLLFFAKVSLARVFSKIRSIQSDFQFTLQKKKEMLQEVLPEISV